MPTVTIHPHLLESLGVPASVARSDAPYLSDAAERYGIDTPLRLAHWLGQILYEGGRGRDLGAGVFREVGVGTNSGGYGWTQLTGAGNFAAYDAHIRRAFGYKGPSLVSNRHIVLELPWRVDSAGWYWQANGGNRVADRGMTRDVVASITAQVLRPADPYASADSRYGIARAALSGIEAGGAMILAFSPDLTPDLSSLNFNLFGGLGNLFGGFFGGGGTCIGLTCQGTNGGGYPLPADPPPFTVDPRIGYRTPAGDPWGDVPPSVSRYGSGWRPLQDASDLLAGRIGVSDLPLTSVAVLGGGAVLLGVALSGVLSNR